MTVYSHVPGYAPEGHELYTVQVGDRLVNVVEGTGADLRYVSVAVVLGVGAFHPSHRACYGQRLAWKRGKTRERL